MYYEQNVNYYLYLFYDIMYNCLDACIPKKVVYARSSQNKLSICFSRKLRQKIKQKNTLQSIFITTKLVMLKLINILPLIYYIKRQTYTGLFEYNKSLYKI